MFLVRIDIGKRSHLFCIFMITQRLQKQKAIPQDDSLLTFPHSG